MNQKFDSETDLIEARFKSLRPRAVDATTLSRLKGRNQDRPQGSTTEATVIRFLRNPLIWSGSLLVFLFAMSHFEGPTDAPIAASRGPVITTLRDFESNRILTGQTPIAVLPGPSDTQIQLIRYHWIEYNHGRSDDGREFYWPEISSEIKPVLLNAY